MTLPPFPYIIKIGIYNSAGELVRILASTRASDIIKDIKFIADGQETTMITTNSQLGVLLPGIDVPDPSNLYSDGTFFIWDVKNNGGQYVNTGSYYIKFEEIDEFGHTNVVIKDIQVIKVEEYVEFKVYNSSGELIKTGREYKMPSSTNNIALDVKDTLLIEKTGGKIEIKYNKENPSDYLIWDGKNDQGIAVTSGNYEIQVTVVTADGKSIRASKSVLILREDSEIISDIKIVPNPFVSGKKTNSVEIKWKTNSDGNVTVYIYNIAGDLVRKIEGSLETKSIKWDLKTSTGTKVSTGNYIIVVNAKSKEGYLDRKVEKLTLILK
jgi:flagellar hook assembly protein FlgD